MFAFRLAAGKDVYAITRLVSARVRKYKNDPAKLGFAHDYDNHLM